MSPDATRHNPDPRYLRQLLQAAGLNQVQAAARLGIHQRTVRYYLSDTDSADYRPAPYLVQFALECAAAAAAAPLAVSRPPAPLPARPDLSTWRALDESDIEQQAPAGASYAEAWVAVELAVAERFAQLPAFLQGGGLADGEQWPLEAIEPARFAVVMAAVTALQEGLRAQLGELTRWLIDDADRPGPTLHRLLAVERNRARVQVWADLGLLPAFEYSPVRYRTEQMRERLMDLLAEQARAGDLAVVPWAFALEQHSPVPLPSSLKAHDVAGRERLEQAHAEWQAQQLEARAATWRDNAEALRLAHGGAPRTAAALRTVLYHQQQQERRP
ncbi:helix-turn-helix transcriptional regulator [Pseudomonas sp. NMI795_08]|uniref:helix-turn-helix transcriptional regulator n=1 Tax=Pseudomonas sp. NMI795_08 TaxID=2903144 RepID=UPI002FCD9E20